MHKRSYVHHIAKLDSDEKTRFCELVGDLASASSLNMGQTTSGKGANEDLRLGPDTWLIAESAVSALILRSRHAMTPGTFAHRFRRWLTGEVLPSIRRTGGYQMGGGQAPPGEATGTYKERELTVRIPDPRAGDAYVALVLGDGRAHVRQTDFEAIFGEVNTYDAQAMAAALTSIAAYYHRHFLARVVGDDAENYSTDRLEHAIKEGNKVARQFLYRFLKESAEAEAELARKMNGHGKAH